MDGDTFMNSISLQGCRPSDAALCGTGAAASQDYDYTD
jgi:hypothetical protein